MRRFSAEPRNYVRFWISSTVQRLEKRFFLRRPKSVDVFSKLDSPLLWRKFIFLPRRIFHRNSRRNVEGLMAGRSSFFHLISFANENAQSLGITLKRGTKRKIANRVTITRTALLKSTARLIYRTERQRQTRFRIERHQNPFFLISDFGNEFSFTPPRFDDFFPPHLFANDSNSGRTTSTKTSDAGDRPKDTITTHPTSHRSPKYCPFLCVHVSECFPRFKTISGSSSRFFRKAELIIWLPFSKVQLFHKPSKAEPICSVLS